MSEMTARIGPMAMDVAAVQSSEQPAGLKRRSVILMIVLVLLTAGLYFPFWFLRRRAGFNRLDAPDKFTRLPFVAILAGTVINLLAQLAAGPASIEQAFGEGAGAILWLVQVATGIVALWQCFRIKLILEDHLTGPDGDGSTPKLNPPVKLSVVMTFFFGVFYLQHVINRDVVGRARAS